MFADENEATPLPVEEENADGPRPAVPRFAGDLAITQGTPALTRSIANAIVIKDQDVFLLTDPDGRIPLSTPSRPSSSAPQMPG
jgi:hypothetical protein